MIILDTDVVVDVLREVASAAAWFNALPADEVIIIPGLLQWS